VSLYKRGDVWHYDFTVKGQRYRGTTGEKAKARAEREVDRLRDAIKLGSRAGRPGLTLRQAADKWFAANIAGKKTQLTVAQRLKILFRHIDPELLVADVGPREVNEAILSRRVEKTRQGRLPTNGTVNRDLIDTTLRPVLNFAQESLEENVRHIKWAKLRLKEPKGRVRSFTADEINAWRDGLPQWHRPLFDFLARYGPRLDEAFFPPSAVNVEACEVTLYDTKNGTDHALQIFEDDMADLAARKARALAAGLDTIWFRDQGGELTPIHWRGFQSASRAALNGAGVANARPAHDLRHHAATTLYRATGNIKLVQDLLNHQSVTSSARYAHTNKADLKKALRHTYGTNDVTDDKSAVESKSGRVT
jgi:integrase